MQNTQREKNPRNFIVLGTNDSGKSKVCLKLEDSGDESEGCGRIKDAEGGQQRNAFVPRAQCVVG